MNRRKLSVGMSGLLTMLVMPHVGHAALPHVSVYRDPGCGCCEAWAQLMQKEGFHISIEDDPNLDARRTKLGISDDLAGCHSAVIDGFVFEGHVPPADIVRFLKERPANARGLSVPGMPVGSPGMGPEGSGEPYDVLLLRSDGNPTIFARHQDR